VRRRDRQDRRQPRRFLSIRGCAFEWLFFGFKELVRGEALQLSDFNGFAFGFFTNAGGLTKRFDRTGRAQVPPMMLALRISMAAPRVFPFEIFRTKLGYQSS